MFHLLKNSNNIILLSMLSAKLWDLAFVILWCLINAILWENRTYTSTNKESEIYNKLLKRISNTYYICSETRLNFVNYLIPIGFIIGPGYICNIKTNIKEIRDNDTNIKVTITIYGWFSIKNLLTDDIINEEKGKYCIVEYNHYNYLGYDIIKENFPEKFFHKNTFVASKYIYDSVIKQYNKSGVYLLYGLPGTGKTTTAKKLFDYFNNISVLCYDLNLIENSATITRNLISYYRKIKPENNKYLIFVIDEVDEIIDKIYNKDADSLKISHFTSQKITKQIWNSFIERISSLNNVILILTTNKPIIYFNRIDKSLFREHRLTMAIHFGKDFCEIDPFVTDDDNAVIVRKTSRKK